MSTLIFVKGRDDHLREEKTKEFFHEIMADGYTYKRFDDRLDLRSEVRRSLIRILDQEFNITPTKDESKIGMDTLEAASPFETAQTKIPWEELNNTTARKWLLAIGDLSNKRAPQPRVLNHLRTLGLLWRKRDSGEYHALAAGILFLGKNPSAIFPQCRIMADAYRGENPDPKPFDQQTISDAASKMVQAVVDFVIKTHVIHLVLLASIVWYWMNIRNKPFVKLL